MTLAYLDSSAFVKTIVIEPESRRLVEWLRQWPDRACSALVRTEAIRAVRPHGPDVVQAARAALAGLQLIQLDAILLDAAADLEADVRWLDAIHLAAAQALGVDLGVVVTYDDRMARAARQLGMEVAGP